MYNSRGRQINEIDFSRYLLRDEPLSLLKKSKLPKRFTVSIMLSMTHNHKHQSKFITLCQGKTLFKMRPLKYRKVFDTAGCIKQTVPEHKGQG